VVLDKAQVVVLDKVQVGLTYSKTRSLGVGAMLVLLLLRLGLRSREVGGVMICLGMFGVRGLMREGLHDGRREMMHSESSRRSKGESIMWRGGQNGEK